MEVEVPSIPSYDTPHFKGDSSEFNETRFRELWAQGRPIVVTDLLHKFKHAWSPEYFIEHYGHQACKLVECQSEREEDRVVADFFRQLGQARALGGDIWKLKDWPPSSDFRTDFPELYDDFENAVPIPSYTRRNGAFNIASHYPTNALAPDLGEFAGVSYIFDAYAYAKQGPRCTTRLPRSRRLARKAPRVFIWTLLTPSTS